MNAKIRDYGNDYGLKAVHQIYRHLQIDEKWSTSDIRCFEWWGNRCAQRVSAGSPFKDNGLWITKIHAHTDLAIYPERNTSTDDSLAEYLMVASLSGMTVERLGDRIIRLHCSAFIHEQNFEWLWAIFSLATIMQVVEAELFCDVFTSKLGLTPAFSEHAGSGPRPVKDDMLNILKSFVIPGGKKPVESISYNDFQTASQRLNDRNLFSTHGETGLSAYIPFVDSTALLQVQTDQGHPILGNGLLYRLTLPPEVISPVKDIDGQLILNMNYHNLSANGWGHFLGSWCLGTQPKTPVYVTFIPAVACNPTVFENMIFSTLNQNLFVEEFFYGYK